MKLYGICIALLLCTGCGKSVEKTTKVEEQSIVYDLNESTQIIQQLIKTDAIASILEDKDPQALATLLKNFSPSEMAMEAEALNYPGVCVALFYKDLQWKELQEKFMSLAQKYESMKFIKIDADILFKITQNAQIDSFPAIIFLKDRKEIARIEPAQETTLIEEFEKQLDQISA